MAQDIKSSAGTARTSGAQRRPPVDPLQQHRELRRAQRHRPLARLRPDEPSALQPLAEQAETLTVPIQHLDQVAAPAAKDEQMPGERILPQHLLGAVADQRVLDLFQRGEHRCPVLRPGLFRLRLLHLDLCLGLVFGDKLNSECLGSREKNMEATLIADARRRTADARSRSGMRARRKIAGQSWEFDGSTITVRIPMTWKRRGGRKVIIAPDGGDAWAPAKPRPDETLIRALARAHRWKRLLEEGKYRSAGELAEAEGVTS